MGKERILLGRGNMGEGWLTSDPEDEEQFVVEKIFKPARASRWFYKLSFWRDHPYDPENLNFPFAHEAVVRRRHLAFDLGRAAGLDIEVLDAEPIEGGLRVPYFEGQPITHEDEKSQLRLDELAAFFESMGYPDWNLRGIFRWFGWGLSRIIKRGTENILIDSSGKTVVIDNEEGFPYPDRRWPGIRFDDVDHPVLKQAFKERREEITETIGPGDYQQLEATAAAERRYWESFRHWEASPLFKLQEIARSLRPISLLDTIDWRLEKGKSLLMRQKN